MHKHALPRDPSPAPDLLHDTIGARGEPRLDPHALTAARAALTLAAGSPWRASLLMARLEGLRARLDRLRGWLLGLTRAQRRGWARRLAVATPAAVLAVALSASPPAHAADITVAAPGGVGVVIIAADGDCSLREAIINANDGAATHADCAAGGAGLDTVILPAGSTFTVPDVDNTANGENGLPSITTEITIDGNGAIVERSPADPDTFRLFHVAATGDLTLDATTVRYGVADDVGVEDGGGIFNLGGVLEITNGSIISGNSADAGGGVLSYGGSTGITGSTITGNSAEYVGGGVYVEGGSLAITGSTISDNSAQVGGGVTTIYAFDVTITGSTISGNSANFLPVVGGGGVLVAFGSATISASTISGNSAVFGGGVNAFVANLDIDHSTISGNSAYYGAGLANFGFYAPGYGTTTLTNSTISGNSAALVGGGVFNGGLMIIRNATITGNSAGYGGGGILTGVLIPYGSTYLTNSIVADQVYGGDCYGTGFTSGDFNLDSDNTCNLTGPNDIPGSANANLGPLALNAPGTTETHALLAGSDALDAGDCSGGTVTDDQRTVLRPQGPACDIGAYELEEGPRPTALPPTAAQLVAFAARQDRAGRVALTWETASEVDVAGFNLERAPDPAGPWVRVNAALIPAAGGAGGASYRYVDEAPPGQAGPPHYRLEVVGASGPPQTFGPIAALRRLFEAVLPWVMRSGGR